jgi:chromosome segregation ATPase
VRNKNLDINNSNNNELPIIPLFNQNEKKILLNILPQKEIEKFEKRYECIDKEKNTLQRKLAFESKLLDKENKELENKYENSNSELRVNEEKNQLLSKQIENQKKELIKLQKKLENIEKSVEDKRKQIVEKDEENKELIKQLKELKVKYGKLPNNNENDDDESGQDDDE